MRKWLWVGAAAWTAATLLYLVVFGLRRMTAGLSFAYGWPQLRLILATFLIAALLSPVVVLALQQVRRASPSPPLRVATYALLGIAYWVGWAVLVAVLFPGAGTALVERISHHLVMGALIILTVFTVVVTVFESRWHLDQARRAEAHAAVLQAELVATEAAELKARLNPGLVFDSLDTASHLMGVDERAARSVLADLSELLRVSLGREDVQLIRLEDELDLLLRYLRIRRTHADAAPKPEFRLPPAAKDWPVPPLVLVSMVDEVLRSAGHGRGAPFRLALSAKEVQGRDSLHLSIELTGLQRATIPSGAAGGGMADALTRLRTACGADASAEVLRAPHGGARIEVAIPAPADPGSLLHPTAHAF